MAGSPGRRYFAAKEMRDDAQSPDEETGSESEREGWVPETHRREDQMAW